MRGYQYIPVAADVSEAGEMRQKKVDVIAGCLGASLARISHQMDEPSLDP